MKSLRRIILVVLVCQLSAALAAVALPSISAEKDCAAQATGAATTLRAAEPGEEPTMAAVATPWSKLAGGAGYRFAALAKQTGDGGFVFAGISNVYGARGADYWMFKLDSTGAPVWSNFTGGADDEQGYGRATSDGGYLASGATLSGAGVSGNWVMKLDSAGNKQWQKMVTPDYSLGVLSAEVSDGYVLLGTYTDMMNFTFTTVVTKLGFSGNLLWQKEYTLGGDLLLTGFQLMGLGDDSLMMTGTVTNTNTYDADLFLMKLSSDGTPSWANSYGGPNTETLGLLMQTPDNDFLLQGATKSWGQGGTTNGTGDVWLVKVNGSGVIQWQKTYGGAGDEIGNAAVDSSGGLILSARTNSFGAGQNDIWAVQMSSTGVVNWQKTYGGAADDIGTVTSDTGGGYLLSGVTNSFGAGGQDVWLAKLTGTGAFTWQQTYGTDLDDEGSGQRLSSGNIFIVGTSTDPAQPTRTDQNAWIINANSVGDMGTSCSFIKTATGASSTPAGVTAVSTAVPVALSVTVTSPSILVPPGAFTTIPSGTFALGDICAVTPACQNNSECDDSNVCTTDTCSSGTCVHANNTASCSDGNACTQTDLCQSGACVGSNPVVCTASDQCHVAGTCNTGTGTCSNPAAANGTACNDGSVCTSNDACSNGACVGGQSVNCDDADACTNDSCNPSTGACVHTSVSCDDSDSCTADSCNPATGCIHTPLGCGPLQLLYPNGGETLATGAGATITWQAPETAATFKLQYTVDNGTSWKTIATALTGRSYHWSVPAQAGNKPKTKVRVTAYNASNAKVGADASNATFTIEVVTLDAPNGGESLQSGSPGKILWDTNATTKEVAKVKLLFTSNGGSSWKAITTLTGNPGLYGWTIPTVTASKTNCLVRVQLLDSAGNSLGKDDSNAKFTINP